MKKITNISMIAAILLVGASCSTARKADVSFGGGWKDQTKSTALATPKATPAAPAAVVVEEVVTTPAVTEVAVPVVESKVQKHSSPVFNPVAPAANHESAAPVALNKEQKKESKKATKSGGKSQLIALILCLLVGTLGIHRFYLGYIGIGIIQLLTFGGFGIWTLIDLIRIVIGDLEPKDGPYDETL